MLYSFLGQPDGSWPYGVPVIDGAGNLYGTTTGGGPFCDYGTIFEVDASGNETVLYSFMGGLGDGRYPTSGLIEGANGVLYGTVSEGGIYGYGAIFKFDLNTSTFSLVYSFNGADGGTPFAGLTRDSAGNLYGTTYYGGNGDGVVFKLQADGTYTVLHYFGGGASGDGYAPYAGVIVDGQGNVYGTTEYGGNTSCNCGVVYEISAQ